MSASFLPRRISRAKRSESCRRLTTGRAAFIRFQVESGSVLFPSPEIPRLINRVRGGERETEPSRTCPSTFFFSSVPWIYVNLINAANSSFERNDTGTGALLSVPLFFSEGVTVQEKYQFIYFKKIILLHFLSAINIPLICL